MDLQAAGRFWASGNTAVTARGYLTAHPGEKPEVRLDSGLVDDPQIRTFAGGFSFSGSAADSVAAFQPITLHGQLDSGEAVTMQHAQNYCSNPPFGSPHYIAYNYLAALSTFRDVQRGIHRKVWPERFALDNPDDKRTKWAVEVWTPKVEKLFGDPPVVFLVDLRNYSLHSAIPMMSTATSFQALGGPGGPKQWNNTVSVDRDDLLKWDGWRSKGRQYITSHDGDRIEILPLLAIYSQWVREFFKWFWEQIEGSNYRDISEFRCKSKEFGYYLKVESTFSQYGPDGKSAVRRPLAAARLERAAFGTSGWRSITRDESGE